MRLVNAHTLRFETLEPEPTEPYAILSHTWGKDGEELSFQDMVALDGKPEQAPAQSAKLVGCCNQAKKEGIKYVWIDTCCIDKTNSVELTEAINSMFRWYNNSAVCYTYLSDIEPGQPKSRIPSSRWFTRGWTLQELLASRKMEFFDSSWVSLGTKSSLSGLIGRATGIPHYILTGFADLDSASVAQKMSWAAKRTTTRPEDMSYCLLGIFGVMISPLYGEGLAAAFERLQEAIMKKTRDDSILAWSLALTPTDESSAVLSVSGGVLATSPAAFAGCGSIAKRSQTETHIQAFDIFGGRIPMRISLSDNSRAGLCYGFLSCGLDDQPDHAVAIPLARCSGDSASTQGSAVFLRPQSAHAIVLRKTTAPQAAQNIQIRTDRDIDGAKTSDKRFWFYLPQPYPYDAVLEEVYPPGCLEKDLAMIRTPKDWEGETPFIVLARFSSDSSDEDLRPWILSLEFYNGCSTGSKSPRAFLSYCDEATSLSEVSWLWTSLAHTLTNSIPVEDGSTLEAFPNMETVAGQSLWVVKLRRTNKPGTAKSRQVNQSGKRKFRPLDGGAVRSPPTVIPQDVAAHILLLKRGHELVRCLRRKALISVYTSDINQEHSSLQEQKTGLEEKLDSKQEEIRILWGEVEELKEQLQVTQEMHEVLALKLLQLNDELLEVETTQATLHGESSLLAMALEHKAFSASDKCVWEETKRADNEPGTVQNDHDNDMKKKEMGALVAYLMQQDPIFVDGKRISWTKGVTLLMYAAGTGNQEFVKQVLAYDSDLTAVDSSGRTVLDWALLSGSEAVSRLLSPYMLQVGETKNQQSQSQPRQRQRPPAPGRAGTQPKSRYSFRIKQASGIFKPSRQHRQE